MLIKQYRPMLEPQILDYIFLKFLADISNEKFNKLKLYDNQWYNFVKH